RRPPTEHALANAIIPTRSKLARKPDAITQLQLRSEAAEKCRLAATEAAGIRGQSRPTLQHAGAMRNHAEHGIGHWGVEPRVLPLFFRALTGPAQSSATFKSRARGSSNPVKSVVR